MQTSTIWTVQQHPMFGEIEARLPDRRVVYKMTTEADNQSSSHCVMMSTKMCLSIWGDEM